MQFVSIHPCEEKPLKEILKELRELIYVPDENTRANKERGMHSPRRGPQKEKKGVGLKPSRDV